MSGAFAAAFAVGRRSVLKVVRRPVVLAFSFLQPLMWMLLFGFLFQRFPIGGKRGYLDFLAPGVCVMAIQFGASQAGIELVRDLGTGFLGRMLGTPAPRWALLAGKLAADALRLLVQGMVVLLVGIVLGARLELVPSALPVAVAALALYAIAISSLSSAVALRLGRPEALATFVHLVNLPLVFTSTALVPVRQMPVFLAELARYNPLSVAVDALRAALGFGRSPSQSGLVVLAVLALVLFGAALAALGRVARGAGA